MIEVVLNDRLGKKVRVKCNEDDTIGDLKKLVAAQVSKRWRLIVLQSTSLCVLTFVPLNFPTQIGTRPEKIKIQKWYTIYKDHITLEDYEIHDGMGLEMYYN